MPKATANINQTKRFDLKSCPGGYVVVRRLSYGLKLQRQELSMSMQMAGEKNNASMNMNVRVSSVAEFDFKHCLVEHNLTDDNDQPLNLQRPEYVGMLDGAVGEEIGMYIDQVNALDEGNSLGVSVPLSAPEVNLVTETPN